MGQVPEFDTVPPPTIRHSACGIRADVPPRLPSFSQLRTTDPLGRCS